MNKAQLSLLTEREKEILRLLSQGFDVKACARELEISEGSVTERLREARRKLGVTSSREAARLLAQFESDPHRFSGNRFSGIADNQFHQPPISLPDVQAEEIEIAPFKVREQQTSFAMFQEFTEGAGRLPLRKNGEIGNSLNKRERVAAIIDVSTKLAGIFALVCLIAILVNLLTERF
jgi:DNA-binding CsgD family transcriptional regulator